VIFQTHDLLGAMAVCSRVAKTAAEILTVNTMKGSILQRILIYYIISYRLHPLSNKSRWISIFFSVKNGQNEPRSCIFTYSLANRDSIVYDFIVF
jgi:hypothetical protein